MAALSRGLLALMQRVQEGSVPSDQLHRALEGAAARIGHELPRAKRSDAELAQVRNADFEHCGHKVDAHGRALIEELSKELDASELLCWEMLLRMHAAAGDVEAKELKLRVKQSYYDGRENMLLLLLDCLKLSLLDPASNPAQPAAVAFIQQLERGAAAGGGAGALGGAAGPSDGLSMQLIKAVEADTLQGLPTDPHRRKELMQVCSCLFLVCSPYSAARPPAATAAALCRLLGNTARLGECDVSELLFLAALAMLLPRPEVPPAQAWLDQVRNVLQPWSGSVQPGAGLDFFSGAGVALDFAAALLSDEARDASGAENDAMEAVLCVDVYGRAATIFGFLQARVAQLHRSKLRGGDALPEPALCVDVVQQLLTRLLGRLTPEAPGQQPVVGGSPSRLFDHMYQNGPDAFAALLRWAAALYRSAPSSCAAFWGDGACRNFAYLTGKELARQESLYEEYMRFLAAVGRGDALSADQCEMLLEQAAAAIKILSPSHMVRDQLPQIVPYVLEELGEKERLKDRGLTVQAHDVERKLVQQHGQSGRLGEATAGLHGLISLHLKAWGCPPHS